MAMSPPPSLQHAAAHPWDGDRIVHVFKGGKMLCGGKL